MGTPIEPNAEPTVQDNGSDQPNIPGPNPAWDEVLSVLPEQFHGVVTPHFQKWDQAAQSKIEAANSSLKEFEAYKPFVEHGITPDEIENGLRVLYEINNNPENVYKALSEAYKFGATPETNTPSNNEDEDETPGSGVDPELMEKLQSQEGLLQTVAQIVLNDAQAKQDAQADIELDRELNGLKEKFGDYDERYVLAMMQNGMSGEDAVKSFQELKQSITPQPFAPTVLGANSGGTGLPSNAVDPTKLSNKDTRNLVAQMLAAEYGKQG